MARAPRARRAFRRRCASIADLSRRDSRSRLSSPRLRAAKSCRVCVMVFNPSVPLLGSRRRERARTPERSIRSGRGHRAGGVTPVETGHRPCSQKPVTHASRLVAQIAPSVAFGLRAENPGRRASSRLTVLPLRPLCARTSRSLLGLVRRRGHRLIRRQRPGPSSTELARRGIIDRDQTRRDRNGDWDIRSWLLSPITRRCCARMTTPARSPSPA